MTLVKENTAREKQKERCRQWHRKMTAERRCHWCGEPSAPDYKNACVEHIERVREIGKEAKRRQITKRLVAGICVICGRSPARYGYSTCASCSRKSIKRSRERRERRAVEVFDRRIDKSLVSVADASKIIGVHRTEIHRLIREGKLKIVERSVKKLWLKEKEVRKYGRNREQRMLNLARCGKCGHEWWLRSSNGNLRCPMRSCRSLHIEKLATVSDGDYRSIIRLAR